MDISKLTIEAGYDLLNRRCFRIRALVTGTQEGCYAEIPFADDDEHMTLTATGMNVLAAELQNGLNTIMWIYEQPEEAARWGTIPESAVEHIRDLREAVEKK